MFNKNIFISLIVLICVSTCTADNWYVWGQPGTLEEGLMDNWTITGNWAIYDYNDEDLSYTYVGTASTQPQATDNVRIRTGSATINSTAGPVNMVYVGEPDASLDVTGGAITIMDRLNVGDPDFENISHVGAVNQSGGTVTVNGTVVQVGEGSTGTYDISGGTFDVNCLYGMRLGNAGGFGQVIMDPCSICTVDVENDLLVGYAIEGSHGKFVQDSGNVNIGGTLIVGAKEGTYGEYYLNYGLLSVYDGHMYMSYQGGDGYFEQNGGTLSMETPVSAFKNIYIGTTNMAAYPTGYSEFVQNAGTIEASEIFVGRQGPAKAVFNGSVMANSIYAGHENGSDGTVYCGGTIDLYSYLWIAREPNGIGRMYITDGQVNVSAAGKDIEIAKSDYSNGLLEISGGELNVADTIWLTWDVNRTATAEMVISGGTVNIWNLAMGRNEVDSSPSQGGGSAQLTIVGSDADIRFGYRLDSRDKWNSTIKAVLDSDGISPIYAQDRIYMTNNNVAAGAHGQLVFDAVKGFSAEVGDEFLFMACPTAGDIAFTNFDIVNENPFYDFGIRFDKTGSVMIDIDGDGSVEAADVAYITVDAIKSPTCPELIAAGYSQDGDINNDCFVDLADLALFAKNWMKSNL